MLVLEPGASYSTDQGYLDFARVLVIQEAKPCFCRAPRATSGSNGATHSVDWINTTVICDQTECSDLSLKQGVPTTLRKVVAKDDRGKRLVFLTDNFTLKSVLIADLCRQHWQVKLLFK